MGKKKWVKKKYIRLLRARGEKKETRRNLVCKMVYYSKSIRHMGGHISESNIWGILWFVVTVVVCCRSFPPLLFPPPPPPPLLVMVVGVGISISKIRPIAGDWSDNCRREVWEGSIPCPSPSPWPWPSPCPSPNPWAEKWPDPTRPPSDPSP